MTGQPDFSEYDKAFEAWWKEVCSIALNTFGIVFPEDGLLEGWDVYEWFDSLMEPMDFVVMVVED